MSVCVSEVAATMLTEEQAMLRDMAAAWVRSRAPLSERRRVLHGDFPAGYDLALYAEMAELGWTGVTAPEAYGGSALGCAGAGVVMEELGRTLVASPLVPSLLAIGVLASAGSAGARDAWLARLVAGEAVGALAVDEGARHAPVSVAATARAVEGGWVLNGVKRPVAAGHAADLLIVSARTAGAPGEADGLTLFATPAEAPGIERRVLRQIDGCAAATVSFHDVVLPPEAVIGAAGAGWSLLETLLDQGHALLAAEMLGAATQALETTLDYLKTRVQFGRPIGSFQVLQHRVAAWLGELELTRSAVQAALAAIDTGAPEAPALASLAKALAGETLKLGANEMIQMHGGIGMTEEHDAGLYLKCARVLDATYGTAAFHRERWARLKGF